MFQAQVSNWVQHGLSPSPGEYLRDNPDAAPFYPGVILDAALPEAFRLEFAARMPRGRPVLPGLRREVQGLRGVDRPWLGKPYPALTIPRDDDNDGIADFREHTAKAQWETVFATNMWRRRRIPLNPEP